MQTIRDWFFFRSLGVSKLIGFSRLPAGKSRINTSEADLLLNRLSTAGIQIPGPGKGDCSLHVTRHHEEEFQAWALKVGFDPKLRLVAVGPGSRMQSKLWPIDRYISVLQQIRDRYGFAPVVFGSKEDWNLGEQIIAACGAGYNATGALSVKASLVGLKSCAFYLGNDTGTMHLAASAGLPCVAVFSHRAVGIGWFPYGVPFRIFQKDVPCKGCELTVCRSEGNRCLTEIKIESVVDGCRELIESGAFSAGRQRE
jgi:ADP-heptose:LPS heptosyltransferase